MEYILLCYIFVLSLSVYRRWISPPTISSNFNFTLPLDTDIIRWLNVVNSISGRMRGNEEWMIVSCDPDPLNRNLFIINTTVLVMSSYTILLVIQYPHHSLLLTSKSITVVFYTVVFLFLISPQPS